jgi:hypothetical protein
MLTRRTFAQTAGRAPKASIQEHAFKFVQFSYRHFYGSGQTCTADACFRIASNRLIPRVAGARAAATTFPHNAFGWGGTNVCAALRLKPNHSDGAASLINLRGTATYRRNSPNRETSSFHAHHPVIPHQWPSHESGYCIGLIRLPFMANGKRQTA